jgi:predicted nuclease of predicted toxin-antitoxin system
MRWLADENVARAVVERLRSRGEDVATVVPGTTYDAIAALARAERRVVITLDLGFAEREFGPAREAGVSVVLLRLVPAAADEAGSLLERLLSSGMSLDGYMTVVTRRGVRQRQLPSPSP